MKRILELESSYGGSRFGSLSRYSNGTIHRRYRGTVLTLDPATHTLYVNGQYANTGEFLFRIPSLSQWATRRTPAEDPRKDV